MAMIVTVIMIVVMLMIVIMVVIVLAMLMIVLFVRMPMIMNQRRRGFGLARGFPQDDRTYPRQHQEQDAAGQHQAVELPAKHQVQHGRLPEKEGQAHTPKSPAQSNQAQLVQIIRVAVFVDMAHVIIIPPQPVCV